MQKESLSVTHDLLALASADVLLRGSTLTGGHRESNRSSQTFLEMSCRWTDLMDAEDNRRHREAT